VDWIKRYVHFHRMHRREDLAGGEAKIEAFQTHLAMNGQVAPAPRLAGLEMTDLRFQIVGAGPAFGKGD
jgi:hypothetical protein